MFLFRRTVTWLGLDKGVFDRFEKVALIAFDLKKVVAAFLDNDARGFVLVVQCVGGDGFAAEYDVVADQLLRGFELAVVAFAFFLEQ